MRPAPLTDRLYPATLAVMTDLHDDVEILREAAERLDPTLYAQANTIVKSVGALTAYVSKLFGGKLPTLTDQELGVEAPPETSEQKLEAQLAAQAAEITALQNERVAERTATDTTGAAAPAAAAPAAAAPAGSPSTATEQG